MVHAASPMLHNWLWSSPVNMLMRTLLILIVCFGLGACATTAPDPSVLAVAERSIVAAKAAQAEELSPTELRFAEDRLRAAREAMAEKDYENVVILVDESEINATLAIEKSRAALERRKVNELQRSNALLREELLQTYGQEFLE